MATQLPTIRIFRPGTFTDISGQTVAFTSADLRAMVDAYDADTDPAPIVIGHPKTDAPAYGWIGGLAMDGDDVVATPSEMTPAFADAVRGGHYRKVSASFYPPKHPANPAPGSWGLKHVGFLGAAAPAVKGLGTVHFASADDDAQTFLIDQEQPMSTTEEVAFAERETALATRETELAERDAAIAAREQQAIIDAQAALHNENVAFADGLIAAGKLAPAGKDKVVGLMDQLEAEAVVSFGEGDGAEMTPLAAFRSLFDTAAPIVAFGEAASADKAVPVEVTLSFATPAGYTVAPDNAQLHARAKQLQASDANLPFWDAFNRARAELAG